MAHPRDYDTYHRCGSYREACAAALAAARQALADEQYGSRHVAQCRGVTYIVERDGIVRIAVTDDGRRLSERRIS